MSAIPPNFDPVPAPWELKGEAWWFMISLYGGAEKGVGPGNFDSLEVKSKELAEEPGAFKGGLGAIMLLRYSESPVGPYDELLIVPGGFTVPPGGPNPSALRITRIYVSTLASVVNGRHNWAIPKHLARFEFIPTGNDVAVRVFPAVDLSSDTPTFAQEPCFAVQLSPSPVPLPAIPFSTKLMPYNTILVQPPLEASEHPEKDGLVGGDTWKAMLPRFNGKMKIGVCKGLLEGGKIGDEEGFPSPDVWRVTVHWPDVNVAFPVADVL